MFSLEERKFYQRHLLLNEIGEKGQTKLKQSKVLIVGLGGLGSPVATYLAAAGVGKLTLVDGDIVEASNLHRQPIHSFQNIDKYKVTSAKEFLTSLNPYINVETIAKHLDGKIALDLIESNDLIIDCTDNFLARYLINDACVFKGKPLVSGAIYKFEGQVSVYNYKNGACLRCLYPKPPSDSLVPNCAQAGVLGVLPGIIGNLQAVEAIKILLNLGKIQEKTLLYDSLDMSFRSFNLKKHKSCPICSSNATIFKLNEIIKECKMKELRDDEISIEDLKTKMSEQNPPLVIDCREQAEIDQGKMNFTKHIALGDIKNGTDDLDKNQEIVIQCRSGVRSLSALAVMKAEGFTNLKSLAGGIIAWADKYGLE
ncbi:MAG: molybdenum cofactor biosynthesis protein MoeB [Candidatus Cloacimonadota bacterium]|nr:MAG: molybdenum cofactor biosynthesis protein MoeB [Candidatus Cloacimonadota bacterium]